MMLQAYQDILQQAGSPKWWDENGTPRYWDHSPILSPNVYANEVVLLAIACQACGHSFQVQMTRDAYDEDRDPLATLVRNGAIHYGDPPYHQDPRSGEYCHAGCTMNVEDLQVLEFWVKENYTWERQAGLERSLPEGSTCQDI